jgi:hypothetical protein
MKSILRPIIVLILSCLSCNEKVSEQKTNAEQDESTLIHKDSSEIVIEDPSINTNDIKILKSVFDSQSDPDINKPIKIYDKDSITDFIYLRGLFPIWESDSIEFYGNLKRKDIDFNKFPVNSLLIIYWNNRRLSRNQMNLLQSEWHNKQEALETVFKPGGIALELNQQLCIYSIDACNSNYNAIETIDSIIKSKLRNTYRYDRIITTCKSEPFQRRVN